MHSEYRIGADLVVDFYYRLKKERNDVLLVVHTLTPTGPLQDIVKRIGGIIVSGWLDERKLIELYDLCDVCLLFSRGGGFELNGLEAISRGEPVIAAAGGAWAEYQPSWCRVPSHSCAEVLRGNPIHVGGGVEIDVEKAIDRAHTILDDLEEYKAKAREWAQTRIRECFTWERAGILLRGIIEKYI